MQFVPHSFGVAMTLIIALPLLFSTLTYVEAVVNGLRASQGQFPYMASLQNLQGSHVCGAAVIHERFVLTAGHCIHDEVEADFLIEYGNIELNEPDRTVAIIEKFYMHPNYTPEVYRVDSDQSDLSSSDLDSSDSEERSVRMYIDKPMRHDIALIKVVSPFANSLPSISSLQSDEGPSPAKLSRYLVAKVELATTTPKPCTVCQLAGWGQISNSALSPSSDHLRYIFMRVHQEADCVRESCDIADKLFCAQNYHRISAAERGDSGGPLVCDGLLVGVLSYGDYCQGATAFLADVSKYRDFIDPIINDKTVGDSKNSR